MQRFLTEGGDGDPSRMPEIARRFAADPDDVLVRNRGLLLWDREWVRYAAHRWNNSVMAHFGAAAAHADGRLHGEAPRAIRFEAALAEPRAMLDRLAVELGLDPKLVPGFPIRVDPVISATGDADRLAEWEVGIWPRFFTPKACRWFRMDAWQGLECVVPGDAAMEWQGSCQPFPL